MDNSSHAAALQKLSKAQIQLEHEREEENLPECGSVSNSEALEKCLILSLLEVFCHRVESPNRNDSWYYKRKKRLEKDLHWWIGKYFLF